MQPDYAAPGFYRAGRRRVTVRRPNNTTFNAQLVCAARRVMWRVCAPSRCGMGERWRLPSCAQSMCSVGYPIADETATPYLVRTGRNQR